MNGEITVEDFKALLLDLYVAQRENRMLRAELEARGPVTEQRGEVTE
jgi:hypothetical protein